MPTFSVIIPTHGRPEFLAEAVGSVLAQTVDDLEVVVVDDASPDPVVVAVDPRVRLVRRQVRGGPGAARNTGLDHAHGSLVLFLDDDDLLMPRRLELALRGLGTARAHAAASEVFFPDGTSMPWPTQRFEGDMRMIANHIDHPAMGQVVHRREDVVPFDPGLRVSEDTEWWIRMSGSAVYAWTDELGLRVRRHEGVRPGVDRASRFEARIEILRRHEDHLDRRGLERRRAAVASAALLAGYDRQALRWSIRALRTRPTMLGLKLFGRAALALVRPRRRNAAAQGDGGATGGSSRRAHRLE